MRLLITVLIAFFMHTQWVLTETAETTTLAAVEAVVESTTDATVGDTAGTTAHVIATVQNASDVAPTESSESEHKTEMNKLLELENEPTSVEAGDSENESSAKTIRSVGAFRDAYPYTKPVLVQPYGTNGAISPCSCYCPPPPPPPPCAAPVYAPPPPPVAPIYVQQPKFELPKFALFPKFPHFAPPAPKYPPPSAYAHYRAANDDDDDDKWEDSMTDEAKPRSYYAHEPASYPHPAPVQYSEPSPPTSYTYPSPAPSASCGQNLLIGCSPTVSDAPCSAVNSGYSSY